MPFKSATFEFDENTIKAVAPKVSGVYGLYAPKGWVYVGETGNLEDRLFQHLRRDNECINRWKPTGFVFERVEASMRVARQDQLILELNPACNQRLC